ncbi:MAG: hypothetical protein MMC33_010573, partial [Icmadophila ericetorum]|nr:hypothetical protein [Icmadophila ericetorum]
MSTNTLRILVLLRDALNDAEKVKKEKEEKERMHSKFGNSIGALTASAHAHWGRDTCTFPTEDQRVAFAAILLFFIYTGYRPAELVDGSKNRNGRQASWDDPDDPDSEDPDLEDHSCEGQDLKQTEDPDYDKPDPREGQDHGSYNDSDNRRSDFNEIVGSYKAICYEDVRLWIVHNPKQGERDLLAMEVTLSHNKGANKKPKPTTFLFREEVLPILCPISHIITLAIRDDAFNFDGLLSLKSAEPFFTMKLKNPMKAMFVHWKPSMLKIPIIRQA